MPPRYQRLPASKGTCNFCGKETYKGSMKQHVLTCKERAAVVEAEAKATDAKRQRLLHLMIEGSIDLSMYWLHVELPANATLNDLDEFLRETWVECCGHLSRFEIEDETYAKVPIGEFGEIDMDVPLFKVFVPDIEFSYEYDFGSTTHLFGKVIAESSGIRRAPRILAVNNPPEWMCENCGEKLATIIDPVGSDGPRWLCEDCGLALNLDIDAMLPVVNSPRVGVCGYTGNV